MVLLGCDRTESTTGDRVVPVTQTMMRVALTFTRIGSRPIEGPVSFEGQAHFVRFAEGDAERVPAILGFTDEAGLPLGTCRGVDSAEELDRAVELTGTGALLAGGGRPEVRLLDAGTLRLKGPAGSAPLPARHYPEVTPYVSGLVYGHDELRRLTLDPGGLYEIAGDGGDEVGAFVARAQAPRAFPQLELPVYHRGEDLDLRWSSAGEASDEMLLRVSWSSKAATHEIRCRVHDDGAFRVRRELLAQMPSAAQLGIVEVSATRVRRVSVSAPGTPAGTVQIGLRTVLPLPVSALSLALPGVTPGALPGALRGDR